MIPPLLQWQHLFCQLCEIRQAPILLSVQDDWKIDTNETRRLYFYGIRSQRPKAKGPVKELIIHLWPVWKHSLMRQGTRSLSCTGNPTQRRSFDEKLPGKSGILTKIILKKKQTAKRKRSFDRSQLKWPSMKQCLPKGTLSAGTYPEKQGIGR